MRRGIVGIVCALVAVLAVAPASAGDDSDMEGRLAGWEKSYDAGDFEALAAHYAEDGCRMPPNMETVNGRAAIHEHMKAGAEMGWAGVELALTSSEASGDMGWATGTYRILGADGAELDHGKWMNVSRKVDGAWLIQCDIWNSDRPMPME